MQAWDVFEQGDHFEFEQEVPDDFLRKIQNQSLMAEIGAMALNMGSPPEALGADEGK